MNVGLFVSVGYQGQPALDDIVRTIVRAEADNFASVWTSGVFDPLTQLAVAAGRTRRIELGTAVVQTFPRHPSALAAQALTVNHASNGRLVLGLGPGHASVMRDMLGFDWSRPVRHMQEYLTCLSGLLSGHSVDFAGDEYRLSGFRLTTPSPRAPSVLVSALGPQMLRLAGRLADGTILWFTGPRYVRDVVVPTMGDAADRADRPMPRIVVGVPVLVTHRADTAGRAVEHLEHLASRPVFRSLLAAQHVDDPLDVCLVGDEEAVLAGLEELTAAGATDIAASIMGDSLDEAELTYGVLARHASGIAPVDTPAGSVAGHGD